MEMSHKCLPHVPHMCNIYHISFTFPSHFLDISFTFPLHFGTMTSFHKRVWNMWKHICKTFLQGRTVSKTTRVATWHTDMWLSDLSDTGINARPTNNWESAENVSFALFLSEQVHCLCFITSYFYSFCSSPPLLPAQGTMVKYLAAKSSRITAKILLSPKQSQKETVP